MGDFAQGFANQPAMFSPLDSRNKEIRLLRFDRPLQENERNIYCSLEVTSLEATSPPVYVALSYQWGPTLSTPPPYQIYVNGFLFPVTTNLLTALIFLNARCGDCIPVWIDAICINQTDDVEKGSQVALMRDIYAGAFHVWAWLIPIEPCKVAMDFLNEAAKHTGTRKIPNGPSVPTMSKTWLKVQLENPQLTEVWNGFVKLFQQPYWRRCWIIQELYVAKSATMLCGDRTARLGVLFGMTHAMAELVRDDPMSPCSNLIKRLVQHAEFLVKICGLLQSEPRKLSSLMATFTHSETSDPRDKIYSFVGIASGYAPDKLPIDYTVEWPEVFRRAARYFVEDVGTLNMLSMAASGSPQLPSWVINFAQKSKAGGQADDTAIDTALLVAAPKPYNAGGSDPPFARFSPDLNHLTCRIIFIDSLSWVLPATFQGIELDPIKELDRRMKVLQSPYHPWLSRLDLTDGLFQEHMAYLALCLYIATLQSMDDDDRTQRLWPPNDFVRFVINCCFGKAQQSDCSPAQWELLQMSLLDARSFFVCKLPQAFSLAADFLDSVTDRTKVSQDKLAALETSSLHVPGYCRGHHQVGEHGDFVCIVLGCRTPLLLRPVSPMGQRPLLAKVVSPAYVYGLMSGEAVTKGLPVHEVTLV